MKEHLKKPNYGMIAVPKETHAKAKKHCLENGLVLAIFAEKAIDEAIDRHIEAEKTMKNLRESRNKRGGNGKSS